MKIDFTRPSHIIFFAALGPALSFGLSYVLFMAWPDVPFWMETLSPVAVYGLLYTVFDRFIWHWPLFRWLGIVQVHSMAGRWYGTQLSSYKKDDGTPTKSRIILEVQQTFSDIRACAYYKRWRSDKCNSALMLIDGQTCLILIYETEPGVLSATTGNSDKGVAKLRYFPGDDTIRGTYFNTRGNAGEITLQRSPKPLLHRFEE